MANKTIKIKKIKHFMCIASFIFSGQWLHGFALRDSNQNCCKFYAAPQGGDKDGIMYKKI